MKTLFFLIIGILSTSSVFAQKTSEVPATVKEAFKKEFPAATVKEWEKENGRYEAEFKDGEKETVALFDPEGKFLGTEIEIATNALPEVISTYLANNYPDYEVKDADMLTEAGNGKISYEVEIRKGKKQLELLFDQKGNLLRNHNGD